MDKERAGIAGWLAGRMTEARQQAWRRLRYPAWLGTLRRVTPLSEHWGCDRGAPVDRYYIEKFLDHHRSDIRGRVLEIKDTGYTDRFGSGVQQRDVLDINADNPLATIVADLTAAEAVAADQFDCFVLTHTLQQTLDVQAAIRHSYRILKPGGVLLVTVPCVSRLAPVYGLYHDFWRFTPAVCSALFGEAFGEGQVTVESYGNVLAGIAFLAGMAQEELTPRELEANDPYFPLVIAVRAAKPIKH